MLISKYVNALFEIINKENSVMEKYLKVFSALSDETRLRIFVLLKKGELCVCELESSLNLNQSRVSHNLRILKEAGLVENKRAGKWIIYSHSDYSKSNAVISTIIKEIEIPEEDVKNYKSCKSSGVRAKCHQG